MINYLIYKIRNEINFLLTKKIAQKPMLSLVGEFPISLRYILFDFDDPTTHLGDRLFFFPLIFQLHKMGFSLRICHADKVTSQLFYQLYGVNPFCSYDDQAVDLVVIAKPSFVNKLEIHTSLLVVDFTDTNITAPITEALPQNFGDLFNINLPPQVFSFSGNRGGNLSLKLLESDQEYYLFNNYINSGMFRKWFLDESSLYKKCLEIKSQNFKIIHVGSGDDRLRDNKSYSFVDLDLRGKLNLAQLITLISSSRVKGSVTYDNFLMHLTGLFNKKAFVLFRGRFAKSARIHHYEHVNNTYFSLKNEPHYLKSYFRR